MFDGSGLRRGLFATWPLRKNFASQIAVWCANQCAFEATWTLVNPDLIRGEFDVPSFKQRIC
ncbi:hypothetical protein C7S18_05410 [Ahniella affigens]|uniref:Uncharacterized protein n=1 Tax=Ahniella affigens TaxID=2021234 RepID=A0A2P1PPA6_9GAMM|nr:hypothetical protein C7S18_05410 [Ahniella affigens]